MKIPHFRIEELVSPEIFQARGEKAWELLRPDALAMLLEFRQKFGPITVNDWHAGGQYKESGLRNCGTATGAKWSLHKFGAAWDMKFRTATPREVFDYTLKHVSEFPSCRVLEDAADTPTWLHADTRNHGRFGIVVIKP